MEFELKCHSALFYFNYLLFQYYPGEDMGIVKRGTLVPLPRKNIAFENGRISEWNGK